MLSQMGFEPTSPGLLVGCDDHYTTVTTMLATYSTVAILQCVDFNVGFPGQFFFQGLDGKAYNSIFMPFHLRIK